MDDGTVSQKLNDFFRACRGSDDAFDERLDALLASVPGESLSAGLAEALSAGSPEDWPRALQLVSLIGGEHGQLWNVLIEAVENRQDLSWPDLMQAVALLKLQNRLPESGRAAELAEDWADENAEDDGDLDALFRLLEDEPEDAPSWLGGIADWPAAERDHLQERLRDMPPGRARDILITWLEGFESSLQEHREQVAADVPEVFSASKDLEIASRFRIKPVIQAFWATDLLVDGTFGAGFRNDGEPPRQFVVAGSLAAGVRFAESFEAVDDDRFVPRLSESRRVSFHPAFVRHVLRQLGEAGMAPSNASERSAAIVETLLEELAPQASSDVVAWERWTKTLVDMNPLDRRPAALEADTGLTLDALDHWLLVDPDSSELASEFRTSIGHVPLDRLRSAMRVWFERSLGPRMSRILEEVRQMGYFWLSLADTAATDDESQRWYATARASARIVQDLADPSRVVATHPFVEMWMKRVFEKARGQR